MNTLSEELINLAKKDIKQFNKIYLCLVNELYAFANYLTADKHKAEDVTAETFIKIMSNLSKFEGSAAQFRAWSYRILRNTAYTLIKRDNRTIYDQTIIDNVGFENENKDDIFSISQIDNLINELNVKWKEVLILKYKRDFSYKEISEITDETEDNLRKIISRSLEVLKTKLGINK